MYVFQQQKVIRYTKRQKKIQFEETKHTSKSEADMARMLELSGI